MSPPSVPGRGQSEAALNHVIDHKLHGDDRAATVGHGVREVHRPGSVLPAVLVVAVVLVAVRVEVDALPVRLAMRGEEQRRLL